MLSLTPSLLLVHPTSLVAQPHLRAPEVVVTLLSMALVSSTTPSHSISLAALLLTPTQLVLTPHLEPPALMSATFPSVEPSPVPSPTVLPMLASSFLPRLHSTCTAGEKTLLSPLSSSLTDRTASLSAKEPTSTLFSLTSTTHATQTLVSMFTHSHFALRNTSHLAHAISPELTTLLFSLLFLLPLSVEHRPPRSVSMPLTTMSFVS